MSVQRRRPSDAKGATLAPRVEPINMGTETNEPFPPALNATDNESETATFSATTEGDQDKTKYSADQEPSTQISTATGEVMISPRLPRPAEGEDVTATATTSMNLHTWVKKRAETAVLRSAGNEGGYPSLVALVEGAILRELARLQVELNGGEDYPPNKGTFRTGRPLGS